MHIASLVERQQSPNTGGSSSGSTSGTNLPAYLWVLGVVFISLAVACCICARRTRQRQILYRRTILNSHRPTASGSEPYAPPWAAFSRTSADPSGLQPPPRARRRGSQASVTSLPLYMENPGAQEVVLLQRAIPKDGDGTAPSTRQTTAGGVEANPHANSTTTPAQPNSVSSAPVSQSAQLP